MTRPLQTLVLPILACLSLVHAQSSVKAQTQQGAVVARQADVRTLLGLSYAALPVGDLGWTRTAYQRTGNPVRALS